MLVRKVFKNKKGEVLLDREDTIGPVDLWTAMDQEGVDRVVVHYAGGSVEEYQKVR